MIMIRCVGRDHKCFLNIIYTFSKEMRSGQLFCNWVAQTSISHLMLFYLLLIYTIVYILHIHFFYSYAVYLICCLYMCLYFCRRARAKPNSLSNHCFSFAVFLFASHFVDKPMSPYWDCRFWGTRYYGAPEFHKHIYAYHLLFVWQHHTAFAFMRFLVRVAHTRMRNKLNFKSTDCT